MTKRLLFGSATQCAFPDCSTPLVLFYGQLLSINAEVAHIRSPEPGGPRYVAGYDEMHAFENLLLLCGSHRHLVEQNTVYFSISRLEQWKAGQVAQTGQPVPHEVLVALRRQVADLSDAVEPRESHEPRSPRREVRLIGCADAEDGSIWTGPATETPGNLQRAQSVYLGVELCGLRARREIDLDFKVREVGLEFDIDRHHGRAVYVFENDLRSRDHDSEVWLARQDQLRASLIDLIHETQTFSTHFRGFMTFDTHEGAEEHFYSKWVSLLSIPSWSDLIRETGIT